MTLHNTQSGIIQWIILIVVAVLVLSYFGFNLRQLGEDETTQDNFSFIWEWTTFVWENYLQGPALWVWNNIVSFVWNNLFLENLYKLQEGEGFNDIGPNAPVVTQ